MLLNDQRLTSGHYARRISAILPQESHLLWNEGHLVCATDQRFPSGAAIYIFLSLNSLVSISLHKELLGYGEHTEVVFS